VKKLKKYLTTLIIFLSILNIAAQDESYFQYIFPKPGSKFISTQTTLIFRLFDKWMNKINPNHIRVRIEGAKSGKHNCKIIFADQNQVILVKPNPPFLSNEKVSVKVSFENKSFVETLSSHFFTSRNNNIPHKTNIECSHINLEQNNITQIQTSGQVKILNGVSVPNDFPHIDISTLEETASGKIFIANRGTPPYMMILENDGTPYFYKRLPWSTHNFKLHPTGTMTQWYGDPLNTFVELDEKYNVIYEFRSPGYSIDGHEIQLLPNGNYLVIVSNWQSIDMSQIVEGGKVNAMVKGNIVQELDRNGNVIFEWRSWDHFNIYDAVHLNLTAHNIDYTHMNAIAVDYDNHLLISSRHLSEITKINRQTGEIIWRFGGVNNEFEFKNDEYGIFYQHDIRPVPGVPNHYTLFDNGNYRTPLFSRAIEFQLDTLNRTATKVWEYRHNPDRYSVNMSNVQRLPNGNTLINWAQNHLPKVTEVTPDGEIVYEMNFIEPANCYNTFRFEWESGIDIPYLIAEPYSDKVTLIFNKFGDKYVSEYRVYGGTSPDSDLLLATSSEPFVHLMNLENFQTYYFRITAVDSNGVESGSSNEEEIYVKFIEPGENLILNGNFSQDMEHWELDKSDSVIAWAVVEDGVLQIQIDSSGTQNSDIKLYQNNIEIIKNIPYVLEFDVWSSEPKIIEVKVKKMFEPFTDYSRIGLISSTSQEQHYRHEFTMNEISDLSAQIVFECGQNVSDFYIDNITLYNDLKTNLAHASHQTKTFTLFSNYPNPFNPVTVISYQLPVISDVELSIYNLLGQKIAILVSGKQEAGFHQLEWDASGLSSGIYYYRIEVADPPRRTGEFQDVKKMVLLR
jgi:hypothetical protein